MKKIILLLTLVGILSLTSVVSAQFDSSHTWGSFGNGNGQFYGMSGVATDTSGNIYVAELDNRVQKFGVSGSYLAQFNNISARSIAIDSSGNIYATVNDSIKKFNSIGNLLNTWGSTGSGNGYFNFPTGIALDSFGNIYVSDTENNRIQKLDSSGNYITSWGTLGSGNGNFKSPAGIAVSGNYVYVADMGNYRVQEFDLNGNYVSSLGSKGNNNTQFNSSIAVANDSSGNIYVADYYNGRVLEYDSNFNYLTQYTGFSYPTALVVASNNLYVLDSGNYQVYEYYNSTLDRSTPTIIWSNPANITYGIALNSTHLNAAASDPVTGNPVTGNFVYTPAAGTVLSAGARTLHADFTPDNISNYTTASKDVIINVSKVAPTITWSNPADITYGTALSSTQLNAVATDPATGKTLTDSFAYTPAAGSVLNAGNNQKLHVNFTPIDSENYTNATADVTINVSEKPVLPVANFTVNVTKGFAPLSIQFNDSSENATAWSWNFGDKQVSQVQNPSHTYNTPGIYTVSLNASNANGYNISTKSNLITVNSTTPPVTDGLVVYYDSRLSGNSLLDLSGNNNTGYTTNVTSGTLSATGADYINLNGVNSKIDVSNNAQTNISSPVSIEFIGSINEFKKYGALVSKYNNGVTGWYLSSSSASPYNQVRFGAGLQSSGLNVYNSDVSLVAGQIYDIVVTYDNNTAYIYINGVDSGSRTWNSPVAGLANNISIGYGSGLPYGNCSMYAFRLYNRSLSSDEVLQNYKSDLWRYKLTPKILWTNPADITYGTALSSTQLNAVASDPVTGNTVAGSFTYNPAAGTIPSAGNQTLKVTFTPADTANYTNATANVTINVKEEPVLPVANFSYAMVNYPPLTVQFTDTSTNSSGANYQWNFGDGSSNITLANPLHTFTSPGIYPVQETVLNTVGSTTKTQNVNVQYPSSNLNEGELQLWTFDASKVNGVPNNIYTTTKNIPYTSNVSLTYNPTLGSIDSGYWHNDNGETYITGAYPTVDQNLTFTMGIDSNSPWSYGYLHTSVASVGVRHASDGSYWIYSYWVNDTGSQLNSSYQIPATSVVNNRVTVSIHSYDSNRINVITSGSTLNVTTPYTTMTTRNLPYTNVIQPLIYEAFYASGDGGWVNVHLYNITQSIPRNIITPYARNDIMGFGLDAPNATNNQLGTDFLISHNQSATVFVSGGVDEEDIEYNQYLFNNGFEEGMHFYPGLASLSLEDSKALMDNEMDHVNSFFGAMPTSWSSHANDDNITHAIYMYQKYGALYRTGYQGMGFISNSINLQNNTWYWWNISSAHGAISPCFTHQTDIYPAPLFAIDPSFFNTFVTNLNSNGINLVGFKNWYCSSMAQNATINLLQYDANHIIFQLNTNGGYPVNINMQTVISPSYLYCDGVSIPFKQTFDGIQFVSAGNGTYLLTNIPLVTPSITWSNPSAITYGTALSSTQLNAVATDPITNTQVEGRFAYNPTSGTVLSAGSQILKTTFTPNDTVNYTKATSNVSLTVNKATPLITWSNPANITYGTPLSETQLNASASVPGNFTYNQTAGTVLSEGTHTLHVDFTPNDTANYTNAAAEVTINVSEKLTIPVANFTSNVTNGFAPLSVQFNGSSENATALSWNFGDGYTSTIQNPIHTYNAPGIYTVSLNASNTNGYNISTKSNLITVNLIPQPRPGLVVYYDGNLSGNSLIDLSGNNNTGYATNVTSGTLSATDANYVNLNGVDSKIDVSNNAQTNISSPVSIEFIGSIHEFDLYRALVSKYDDRNITGWYTGCSAHPPYQQVRFAMCAFNTTSGSNSLYGDKSVDSLVAGQVYHIVVTYDNNTARIYINGVNSGNHTWNSPIIGNPCNITIGSGSGIPNGNCSMYVFRLYNKILSPDEVWQNYINDLSRYTIPSTITWSKPADIPYGTALSSTQLNANASVAGNFTYNPAAGTILSAGDQTLQVTFTPADTANYSTATSNVSLTVNKATPLITWTNPANITYGTSLSETQLNASASIPGSFIYTPASGTVLSIGTHTLHVDFTPSDTANYTNAAADVTINVSEKPVLPVANFTVNVTKGFAPLSVQFNDSSENATAWSWNFGDKQVSQVQNPSHTYNTPGIYTVSLNASNANGYNTSTKLNLINVNSTTPPVTDDLVVYYDGRLSENSLLDLSGNNNTGYATNVTSGTNQLTRVNYINLNGVNSKIDVSNNAQTNISSPVSIEFIGSINEFKKYGALVSKYNNGVTGWYLSCSSADPYNQIRVGIGLQNGGLNVYNSNVSLVAGKVYDIVFTYDNNTTHLYVNGIDSGSKTRNSPIAGLANNISIGYGSGLPYGNCSMYAFRLYNRSLSSDEVLQNYKSDLWRYKLTPKILWTNPADITYGTALSSTQLNAVASDPVTGNTVAGSFAYNPAAGTILSAGTQTLQVTFTPADTVNYSTATSNVSLTVNKATPLITWTNPANITSGTLLSETQLNASASVPGNFTYNPAAGTVLSIGTHTLHVDFTPSDTENYINATTDVIINVSEKPVLPVANFTFNVTSGLPPLSVKFNDTSTGSPASWSWNFGDGQTSTVQNPSHTYNTRGIYTVSLNASNANGYNISTKSNLITVIIPQPRPGLVVYYDGNLSGNSLVDLSGNNNIGYATNVISGTNQATGANYINLTGVNSKIDVSNNAQTNVSSPMTIEFIGSINEFKKYGVLVSKYNGGVTGWYLSSSSASPYNQIRVAIGVQNGGLKVYNSDVSLVAGRVYHIVATYDNNTASIYVNGVNSGTRNFNSPVAGLANNISIGYGSGLPYGNCSMYAFRLYNRSLSSDEVLQNYKSDLWRYKLTPKILWTNPADITYGTALSSTQLNATASDPVTGNTVAGSFAYNPAAGTILSAGTQTLQVTFTPADTVNYSTATNSVSLTVNKATPLITWSNPSAIDYGTALSGAQLDASASVPGSFVYNPVSGTVLSQGTHTLHVDFIPTDTADYTTVSKDVTINVNKMAPTITWSNPAAINYGTAISETQLNAAASVPGSFAYNPASGTVLVAGTQTLQTTFTPTDNTNYTTATSSVSLTVNKATPLITWSSPVDITYGTSLSETQLNASSSVPGSFVYNPASGTVLSEGTHTLHVDFTPSDATNYTIASSNVSITVVNNAPVTSSSGNREYSPVKQIILEPNNTQPLNSSEDTGNDVEYESGNKTTNEDNGNKTGLESENKTIKGLQTEQKESHSIPGFEIYCGVVCLLGLFLYKRK